MKILVIEDDAKIANSIAMGLGEAGFQVDLVEDGGEGIERARAGIHDLIILDVMLPNKNGFQIMTELRAEGFKPPFLILSAKRSLQDRVRGLQLGGDDYMVKPFAFAELVARVQALVRRASVAKPDALQLAAGEITLDLLGRSVSRAGKAIELQLKEFFLLEYFVRNSGCVLTKTQILKKVWNYDFDPQTNVVDVLVCRLRNKIDKDFSHKTIETVRGIGYVFKEPQPRQP